MSLIKFHTASNISWWMLDAFGAKRPVCIRWVTQSGYGKWWMTACIQRKSAKSQALLQTCHYDCISFMRSAFQKDRRSCEQRCTGLWEQNLLSILFLGLSHVGVLDLRRWSVVFCKMCKNQNLRLWETLSMKPSQCFVVGIKNVIRWTENSGSVHSIIKYHCQIKKWSLYFCHSWLNKLGLSGWVQIRSWVGRTMAFEISNLIILILKIKD